MSEERQKMIDLRTCTPGDGLFLADGRELTYVCAMNEHEHMVSYDNGATDYRLTNGRMFCQAVDRRLDVTRIAHRKGRSCARIK